jgi:hypothetical protein
MCNITTAKMVTAAEGMAMIVMAAAVTAKTAAVTETAVVVMPMAEKAAVDVTDGRGGGRSHIGGNTGS